MKSWMLSWMYAHPWTHPIGLYEWLLARWAPEPEPVAELEATAAPEPEPESEVHDWRAQLPGQQPWIRITQLQHELCVKSGIPVSDGLPDLALPQGRDAGFYGRELVAA